MGVRCASCCMTARSFMPAQTWRRVSSCQSITPTEKTSERRSLSSFANRSGAV